MKLHFNEVPHLPLMAGSIAALLVGIFVFAAVIDILPATGDVTVTALASDKVSIAGSGNAQAQTPKVQTSLQEGKTRGRVWADCEECGVVLSRQKVARNDAGTGFVPTSALTGNGRGGIRNEDILNDAVTVRMKDGSNRVFMDAHPANWRPGERVIFIEGAKGPSD